MSVISFSSLKGGVGKTSLSMNVAHAFAKRGCQTLVIDLDPAGHASTLLLQNATGTDITKPSCPLVKLFLSAEINHTKSHRGTLVDAATSAGIPLLVEVRENVHLISSGEELRHFLWGRGARLFKTRFRKLIEELRDSFDYIVIDSPPDFNVLTRNTIAVSDMVVVPIDSSAMSIKGLEELVSSADHIQGPCWVVARTLVGKSASRIRKISSERLQSSLTMTEISGEDREESIRIENVPIDDADEFINSLQDNQKESKTFGKKSGGVESEDSPIYLLNSLIYRTEQQNRLSFDGKTSFDNRVTATLASQYLSVAKEIEELLSIVDGSEDTEETDSFFGSPEMQSASLLASS